MTVLGYMAAFLPLPVIANSSYKAMLSFAAIEWLITATLQPMSVLLSLGAVEIASADYAPDGYRLCRC